MSRYILDTNILAFALSGETQNLSAVTKNILGDFSNQLHTRSICVLELLQLYRINKRQVKKFKTALELVDVIENFLYKKILPYFKQHNQTLAKLEIVARHKDPFDHAIIAQAISEKLILVSSDKKFKEYTEQNLDFVSNKR